MAKDAFAIIKELKEHVQGTLNLTTNEMNKWHDVLEALCM